jgi:hypothetical protein
VKAKESRTSPPTTLASADPTRVFISYRRGDSEPAAAHLRHSLEKVLGEGKIFRDLDTIKPGQDFETTIQEAIRGTTVCLVLIGETWLTLENAAGTRRIDEAHDYVRTEIEMALNAGVEVIPLLVEGARMPRSRDLPESIKALATKQAYELPWALGIKTVSKRILELEQRREEREAAERAERQRLDLSDGKGIAPSELSDKAIGSLAVVARAMEISLARQGHKVWLSGGDILNTLKAAGDLALELGSATTEGLFHVLDFIGVKAKGSNRRYVARSYALRSLAEIPVQLELGRPVIAAVNVPKSWYEPPILRTGNIDVAGNQQPLGNMLAVLVGWDPSLELAKVLLPWPNWGKAGMGTMTRDALERYVDPSELRSVEPVLLGPSPFARPSLKPSA